MAERPALPRIINQEATRPGPRLDHIYERYIGPSSKAVQAALDHLHAKGKARRVPPAAFYFLITHGAVGRWRWRRWRSASVPRCQCTTTRRASPTSSSTASRPARSARSWGPEPG